MGFSTGLNKKYKTKSEVMRNSAQQRIRSYFVTVKLLIFCNNHMTEKSCLFDFKL